MGKFGKNRIPKFMMGEPIPESHDGKTMNPTILSLSNHGDDHAMIIIKTHDGQEVELRFDYDGDGMLTAQHGDHEYSIPVEVEIVSDMDESAHIYEISNAVRRRAFMKARDMENSLDPEKDMFKRNKAMMQAHAFQQHIDPEIQREAQSIAKLLGDDVRAELKKANVGAQDDDTQAISIMFHQGSKNLAGLMVYSTGKVEMTVGSFPDNVQRRLVRFIDKVKEVELSTPDADQMSEKLTKGQPKLGKNRNGKPDFLDVDKDGDKKESMKKAFQDKEMGKAAKTFESFVTECWNPMEEGYSSVMSEEAKQAIKKVCEDLLIKEAQMCDEDMDPMHTYETYLNECGSYMTECMMTASQKLKVKVDEAKKVKFVLYTNPGNLTSAGYVAIGTEDVREVLSDAKRYSDSYKILYQGSGTQADLVKAKNMFSDYSFGNKSIDESTAYSCDTCGERAEHEEIEENPRKRCSNCGDSNWSPEY
jgi:hypothetical protein